MKLSPLILALLFTSVFSAQAYEFKTPESAVYDPQTEHYFVSNFRGNSIARVDQNGKAADFVTELSAPLGLVVSGNTLYAIDSPRWVKGFDLKTGKGTFSIEIPESQFLNDITTDHQGTLYVTDSRAGHIYRINIEKGTYELLVPDQIPGVNGILYDPNKNRLIACRFKNPSSIIEIYPENPKVNVLTDKNLLNLDGITMDAEGNFYISTWGEGSFANGFGEKSGLVYRFEPSFQQPPSVALSGYYGPADISFSVEKQAFLLPLFLSNRFEMVPYSAPLEK